MESSTLKAVKKAMQAADCLAKAEKLMREAAVLTNGTTAADNDFFAWAHGINKILMSVGPAVQKIAEGR